MHIDDLSVYYFFVAIFAYALYFFAFCQVLIYEYMDGYGAIKFQFSRSYLS